ncbi:MAG: SpoIID/LytB domain-containing protein [Cellulosilyticaceae bacterium]
MSERRASSRTNTRYKKTRRRGYKEKENRSGTVLIMIGVMLIAGYFLLDEAKLAKMETYAVSTMNKFMSKNSEQNFIPSNVTPCTQAHIAKILVYTLLEKQEVPETKIGDHWYNKYYTMLEKDGRFTFLEVENAMNPITYSETLDILKNIVGDTYQVGVESNDELNTQFIALDDFLKAYEQALNYAKIEHGINYEEVSILGTTNTNTMLLAWQVATEKGIYGFEGLILDPYKDYTLKVITKNKEILGVVDTVSNQSTIDKGYIKSVEDGVAVVQVGALTFDYIAPKLTSEYEGSVGTITIQNSQIIDFALQGEDDLDTVLRVNEKSIEFEKAGTLSFDDVLVYNGMENGTYSSVNQLFPGAKVSYTTNKNKLATIKVVEDSPSDTLRVVITEDGFGKYTHEGATIISEGAFQVQIGDSVTMVEANTPWDATKVLEKNKNQKAIVTPKGENKLIIQSISRGGIYPSYDGHMEIYAVKDGYQVVNVVGIEDYVAGVITSEMPTSYGIEAAKVQAVAARSYALSHYSNSKFAKYGAQIDDTVSSQVYNNKRVDDIARKAANETKGEVLMHNESIISGNFFATSSGYTANFGETWANGEIFPTNTPIYLVARQQYLDDALVNDMTKEDDALAFFMKESEEVDAFDSDSPWFRWKLVLTGKELTQIVNSNVNKITSNYPNTVKVKNKKDEWDVKTLETIGDVQDVIINKRGSGGNIMEMTIKGEKETIKISTEYLIRSILAPVQTVIGEDPIVLTRADNTEVKDMNMLPSAFFSPQIEYTNDNKIKRITLYGGGFGHGVGMSQDGVKGMSEKGYTYKEILKHYYAGTEIKKI